VNVTTEYIGIITDAILIVLFFICIYFVKCKYKTGVFTSLVSVYTTLTMSNYILGLNQLLEYSKEVNSLIMIFFITWVVYGKRTSWKSISFKPHNFLDFGILIVVVFFLYKSIPEDFVFKPGDDYSSWGPNVKSLYFDKSLSTNFTMNSNSHSGYFQLYPPGQPLIQFLILQISSWSEKTVLFAINLYKISTIMMVLEIIFKKRLYLIYSWAIPVISLFVTYSLNFFNIYADSLLAIIFLGILTVLYLQQSQNSFNLYLGLVQVMLLAIIKPSSVFFIGILFIVFATIEIYNKIKVNEERKSLNLFMKLKTNRFIFIILLGGLVTEISWRVYTRINLTSQSLIPSSLLNLDNLNNGINFERIFETLRVFRDRLQDIVLIFGFNLSTMHILIAILALSGAMYKLNILKDKYRSILVGLLFGFVFYFTVIFYTYNFISDEYERSSGGSIIRYLSTYIVPWLVVIMLILLKSLTTIQKKISSYKIAATGITLSIVMLHLLIGEINRFDVDESFSEDRRSIEKVAEYVGKNPGSVYLIDQGSRIDQGSNGMSKNIFTYLVMPNKVNLSCWLIGNKMYEDNIGTCDISEIEISNFDYLYIVKNDGQITENSITRDLHDDSDNLPLELGLYEIEKNNLDINLNKTLIGYP